MNSPSSSGGMPIHYVEVPTNLPAARQAIAGQRLDVLYYADIGMDPVTYSLAFSRLAPVQCVTWGHPVTTGLDTIDYFISMDAAEPEDAAEHYTETLVRLKALSVYYYRPEPPASLKDRAAFGLPEECHLYSCPQTLFKLHPEFDDLLGAILRRDPQGHPRLARWQVFLVAGISSGSASRRPWRTWRTESGSCRRSRTRIS